MQANCDVVVIGSGFGGSAAACGLAQAGFSVTVLAALNPFWRLLHVPVTVHNLGKCPLADSPDQGVLNPDGDVFGHPGLFVLDGVIGANLRIPSRPSQSATSNEPFGESSLKRNGKRPNEDSRPQSMIPYQM